MPVRMHDDEVPVDEALVRAHALRVLAEDHESFGRGPKWSFSVDTREARGVGYVDCDLDNCDVPSGEANISYASHPAHRGEGHVSRAVRLVSRFLHDHTGARTADIITDAANEPSLRVARAVGAPPVEEWTTDAGRTLIRHRLVLAGGRDPGAMV